MSRFLLLAGFLVVASSCAGSLAFLAALAALSTPSCFSAFSVASATTPPCGATASILFSAHVVVHFAPAGKQRRLVSSPVQGETVFYGTAGVPAGTTDRFALGFLARGHGFRGFATHQLAAAEKCEWSKQGSQAWQVGHGDADRVVPGYRQRQSQT